MTPSDVKATLSFSDGSPSMELPIYKGSIGPDVIDIRKLYGQTGKFTYDPGFLSTASCNSTITYIDGDKGELAVSRLPDRAAGREIHADFLEMLLPAALRRAARRPGAADRFHGAGDQSHDGATNRCTIFFRGFRRDAHPMATMVGVVGAMAAFYHDSDRHQRPLQQREVAAIRHDRQAADDGAAMAYKYSIGQPFVYPKNKPVLRRQLPEHDVSPRPGRGLRRQSDPGKVRWTGS